MGIQVSNNDKRGYRNPYEVKVSDTLATLPARRPIDIHQGETSALVQLYFYSQTLQVIHPSIRVSVNQTERDVLLDISQEATPSRPTAPRDNGPIPSDCHIPIPKRIRNWRPKFSLLDQEDVDVRLPLY
jgi:hypothetical protein